MKKIIPFAVLMFMLGSLGCSSDEDDDEETNGLVGSWRTDCFVEDDEYYINTIAYTETAFASTITSFSDSTCATQTYSSRVQGTYTLGATVETPASSTELNVTATATYLTIVNADYIDSYNGAEICGFSDWAASVEKEITDTDDCGLDSDNPIYYDVVKIEATKITYGDGEEDDEGESAFGKTAATRPTSLESVSYTKQ